MAGEAMAGGGLINKARWVLTFGAVVGAICISASDLGLSGYFAAAADGGSNIIDMGSDLIADLT
jgi:hypothetical protein